MDYQNDFETWKEKIEALPFSEVKLPNQPIDEITASAETLAKEAAKDKEQLAKAGLDVILIDELSSLSGALDLLHLLVQWLRPKFLYLNYGKTL